MDFKIIWMISILFSALAFVQAATPTGPDSINLTVNETSGGVLSPSEINISGGNLSKINITITTQNSHWKAFIGWVFGSFTLDDSSGNSVYDWSLSSVSGQVYATRNSSTVNWSGIGCATSGEIDTEDTVLDNSASDNISSTFSGTNNDTFSVAGVTINQDDCFATNPYVNNQSQNNTFEQIVLHDSSSIVFAAKIENSETGYDGTGYDFQMIVPENASEGFSSSTAYYLYVELN